MAASSSKLYPVPFVDTKNPVPKLELQDFLLKLNLIIPDPIPELVGDDREEERHLELPTALRARALTLESCFGLKAFARLCKIGVIIISHALFQGNLPALSEEEMTRNNVVKADKARDKARKLYAAGNKDYLELSRQCPSSWTPELARWRYAISIAKSLVDEMGTRLEGFSETEESTEGEINARVEKWLKLVIERITDHPELADEFKPRGRERAWAMNLLEQQRGETIKIVLNTNTSQEELEISKMLGEVLIEVTDSGSSA